MLFLSTHKSIHAHPIPINRRFSVDSRETCPGTWATADPGPGGCQTFQRRQYDPFYCQISQRGEADLLDAKIPMNTSSKKPFQIWVDADACPAAIKEILFRTSRRLQVALILVANQTMRVPSSSLIQLMTVPDGADVADNKIIELLQPGDVVITGDIPLAARVVEQAGIAIGVRGELLDDSSVHDRLASRDLMEQFRAAGVDTRGPKPLTQKDLQTFANQLDRMLTLSLRKRST